MYCPRCDTDRTLAITDASRVAAKLYLCRGSSCRPGRCGPQDALVGASHDRKTSTAADERLTMNPNKPQSIQNTKPNSENAPTTPASEVTKAAGPLSDAER